MTAPLRAVLADRVLVHTGDPSRRYEQLECGHPGRALANADARTHQEQQYAAHLAAGGRRMSTVTMPPHWVTDAPWPRNPTRARRFDAAAAARARRCHACTTAPTAPMEQWLEVLVSEPGTLLDLPT